MTCDYILLIIGFILFNGNLLNIVNGVAVNAPPVPGLPDSEPPERTTIGKGNEESIEPVYVTNFIPAAMQALAYYTDMMQYEQIAMTTIEPPLGSSGAVGSVAPISATTQSPWTTTTTTSTTTTTNTPRPTTTWSWTTTPSTTTQRPSTSWVTTQKPTTSWVTTQKPTTSWITTQKPTTSWVTTQKPTTSWVTTQKPTTSWVTTQKPSTSWVTTQKPTTSWVTTQKPTTSWIATQQPTSPWITTKPPSWSTQRPPTSWTTTPWTTTPWTTTPWTTTPWTTTRWTTTPWTTTPWTNTPWTTTTRRTTTRQPSIVHSPTASHMPGLVAPKEPPVPPNSFTTSKPNRVPAPHPEHPVYGRPPSPGVDSGEVNKQFFEWFFQAKAKRLQTDLETNLQQLDPLLDPLPRGLLHDITYEPYSLPALLDTDNVNEFLRVYDDYGPRNNRQRLTGKKRVPPTKPYVEFLMLYDLLKREAKQLMLNKYNGYSLEIINELKLTSSRSGERQLHIILSRMLERGDCTRPDVITRVKSIIKDLENPSTVTSMTLRYIPALQFDL